MQGLRSNREVWIDLAAHGRRLREFAFASFQMLAHPTPFQHRVVGYDPIPKIFLQENLTFKFNELGSTTDFAVNRAAQEISNWIRKPVDCFQRRIIVMNPIIAPGIIIDVPIGEVERDLESISDAVFKLMPKIEFVRIRRAIAATVKLPCDPVFQFKFALVRGCDLVGEREVTLSRVNW